MRVIIREPFTIVLTWVAMVILGCCDVIGLDTLDPQPWALSAFVRIRLQFAELPYGLLVWVGLSANVEHGLVCEIGQLFCIHPTCVLLSISREAREGYWLRVFRELHRVYLGFFDLSVTSRGSVLFSQSSVLYRRST